MPRCRLCSFLYGPSSDIRCIRARPRFEILPVPPLLATYVQTYARTHSIVFLSDNLRNSLREIIRRFGTPTYAYDLARIRAQVRRLRDHLPAAVEIFYSLKANAALGLCGFVADCGLGADVASAGEILIARAAGFAPPRWTVGNSQKRSQSPPSPR